MRAWAFFAATVSILAISSFIVSAVIFRAVCVGPFLSFILAAGSVVGSALFFSWACAAAVVLGSLVHPVRSNAAEAESFVDSRSPALIWSIRALRAGFKPASSRALLIVWTSLGVSDGTGSPFWILLSLFAIRSHSTFS